MKHILLLSGLALALSTAPLAAQSTSDDGLNSPTRGVTAVGGNNSNRGVCGSGTTTTFYNNSNGQAGAMIDIAVGGTAMTIECMDLAFRTAGLSTDIEVYAIPGTCVGNEAGDLCALGWVLIGTGTVISGASNIPVNVVLSGAPYIFAASST